ncbi:MAG: ABC transporter ATP-binding protein [Betaproteobacteria bacterium]|nr:ABC transporter ATP-binding protein [Betaproteobacteria bacterium]
MLEPVLKVTSLQVAYGGIQAVKGIDFEVRPGELVTLIGANGAGKTTTLKALTGDLAWSGQIELFGESIQGIPTHTLVRRGLALVPEGRGVFTRMSVIENLQMGAFSRTGAGNNAANSAAEIAADIERMLTLFPRLRERTKQLAGTMSGGEQQMLAMSRALMGRPRLLLLDEPSMGLSPILVEKIFDVIRTVSAAGTPILLVEQNARLALGCAHRGYVMESGQITLTDAASVLLNDARVRSAYLGEDGAG